MKNKKLDAVLAMAVIIAAVATAIWAFTLPTVSGWAAGCLVISFALMTWLCKRVQNRLQKVLEEKDGLDIRYHEVMNDVTEMGGQLAALKVENEQLKSRIQELTPETEAQAVEQHPEDVLAGVKKTVAKMTERSKKKK